MKKISVSVLSIMMSVSSAASAQDTYYWPPPASNSQQGQMAYFPMGTPLVLTTRTQVSTKDNKQGDRIYLEVAENLIYNGQVVVPIGSPAVAQVIKSERNGHFGKKGKLEVRLLHVQTPSGPIRLTGRSATEGKSGTAASVATIVLVSWLGFLIHGTSAKLAPDTVVTAYLAEDLRFMTNPAAMTNIVSVRPDRKMLPARFDPSVFSSAGPTK